MSGDRGELRSLWHGVGGAQDGGGDGVLGLGFNGGGKAHDCVAVKAVCGVNGGDLGPAFGQGAGFVEGHGLDGGQRLKRVAFAEKDAHLRGAACADHDGCGGGEAHCAGAGDDQDGHSGDQGVGQGRAKDQPDDRGQGRKAHDGGDEPEGDFIDHVLDRELGALCGLDQFDDAGQHRVGPHGSGAEFECTGGVDGAADDGCAGLF